MDTIDYYDRYASKIFEDTVDIDMEEIRQEFEEKLDSASAILDLGCGSGRDGLAFYEDGYDVTLLDASEEMCKLAEIHTGLEVLQMTYEDMEFDEVFDGIWGSGALIHVPEDELNAILTRIIDALCEDGILYLSFREGDFEGSQGGCYYCDYTQGHLERILEATRRLEVEKIWTSEDPGGDPDITWLHVLARKIS